MAYLKHNFRHCWKALRIPCAQIQQILINVSACKFLQHWEIQWKSLDLCARSCQTLFLLSVKIAKSIIGKWLKLFNMFNVFNMLPTSANDVEVQHNKVRSITFEVIRVYLAYFIFSCTYKTINLRTSISIKRRCCL